MSSLRPRTVWRKGLFFAWINAKVAEIYESLVQELLALISGYRVWLKYCSMGAVNQTHAGFCAAQPTAADCGGRCKETAEIRKSPKRKGRGMPAPICLVPIPETRPDSTYFSRSARYHPILPALCLLLHSLLLFPKLLFFSLKQTEFSTGIIAGYISPLYGTVDPRPSLNLQEPPGCKYLMELQFPFWILLQFFKLNHGMVPKATC